MRTLRTVFQTGTDRHNYLGNDYELFTKTLIKDDEFDYYFKELFNNPEKNDIDNVFAILMTPDALIPLYKCHKYYIMNNDGSTYLNISFKEEHINPLN